MDDKSFNVRVPKRWVRIAMIVGVTALVVAPLTAIASHSFTDVPNSNIFHADIEWLADAGVTKGCNPPSNTQFCPKDNVTREAMSAFMRRFAKYIDAEDGTPGLADDADMLASKDPTAYEDRLSVRGHGFFTDGLGALAPGSYELASVDITVPAAGIVLVQGTASWETSGVDSNIVQWLELDEATPCDSFADGDVLTGSFSEGWLDGADAFDSTTTVSMSAVSAGSAGSHTAYICATIQTGTATSIDRTAVAQWSPNGTLSLTGASSGSGGVDSNGVLGK